MGHGTPASADGTPATTEHKPATIYDVAARAGVSKSLVSLVLPSPDLAHPS